MIKVLVGSGGLWAAPRDIHKPPRGLYLFSGETNVQQVLVTVLKLERELLDLQEELNRLEELVIKIKKQLGEQDGA